MSGLAYMAGGLLSGAGQGMSRVGEMNFLKEVDEAKAMRAERLEAIRQKNNMEGRKFTQDRMDTRTDAQNTRTDLIRKEDLDRESAERTTALELKATQRGEDVQHRMNVLAETNRSNIAKASALYSKEKLKGYTERIDKRADMEMKKIELETVKSLKGGDGLLGTNQFSGDQSGMVAPDNSEAIAKYETMLEKYDAETSRMYPELSGAAPQARADKAESEAQTKEYSKTFGLPETKVKSIEAINIDGKGVKEGAVELYLSEDKNGKKELELIKKLYPDFYEDIVRTAEAIKQSKRKRILPEGGLGIGEEMEQAPFEYQGMAGSHLITK